MILISLRNDSNITIAGLSRETSVGNTAINNNLNILQSLGIIKRYLIFKTKFKSNYFNLCRYIKNSSKNFFKKGRFAMIFGENMSSK